MATPLPPLRENPNLFRSIPRVKRILIVLLALAALAAAAAFFTLQNTTITVPTHTMKRGDFEDGVTTNGRIEPSLWASARAEREGLVQSVPVTKGQAVSQGATLAVLDAKEAQADLNSANARIEESRATVAQLESGGRRRDQVEIDESIRQRRLEKAQVEKDLQVAQRLAARNAGTREEVRILQDRLDLLNTQIAGLEARRPVLVTPAELASAQARLREAQSAADLARQRISDAIIRAPIAGTIYQLDAKPGTFLTPGTLVANIGRLDTLKVLVFVDEPELGRVQRGQAVSITWDAIEGRKWTGTVEKTPTQIVALGTRQVGEVECLIDNPDGLLLPGTNINATIETKRESGVLLLPKEALRTRDNRTGVYRIENNALAWRDVQTGPGNVTAVKVLSGLQEGDVVALGPDTNLKPGAKVSTTPIPN
jgi:HlyD family secretion protein